MLKTLDDDLVMGLVDRALSQPLSQREAYVRTECDGDTGLFQQIWGYVEMEGRMSGFLQRPAIDYLLEAFPDGVLAGQPFLPDEAFLSGQPFQAGEHVADRFRIIRRVAEGGMGIVYEAVDERLQRRIAIKCAKAGFGDRLPPEVRHASEISHPNVCKIFDIHTASTARGDVEFLTMEFLDGKTLSERLRAGPLTASEIGAISTQLCAGLAEAHRNRVIHGDLKSNNVILTAVQGTVRAVITDFGLARKPPGSSAAGDGGNTLQSAPVAGARRYMAPELRKGAKPTAVSDVYALGIILRDLTSEKRPGAAVDAGLPARKAPSIPRKWDGVIERCLDPDPARRYEDAGSLAKALSPRYTRRWVMAAIAAVLLAGVSGVVSFQRAVAPQQTVRLALRPFQSGEDTAQIAARLTSDTAIRLAGLRGNSRVKPIFLPLSSGLHPDANQMLHGTVDIENGDVAVHAYLTDTHSGVNTKEWAALYKPAEIRYAPAAIAAVVTSALHLPPLGLSATVNAAARKNYEAGLSDVRRNVRQEDAVAALERAVAADPDSPVAYAGLAEA